MQDLFDQVEAQGPGERQTDLEDLIAEKGKLIMNDYYLRGEEMQTNHKYSCGEYQVHHVDNMEYLVIHAPTGGKWGWFQGKPLINLSDAAACAQWHNKYDQEEM